MSDQATAAYYRLINQKVNQRLGGWHIAEIIISSVNFGIIEDCVRHDRWSEAARYLAPKAHGLERAGADFLLCASNTLHCVSTEFTRGLTIPFLHIADPTGRSIRRAGLKTVALLGTKPTMEATFMRDYYAQKHGLDLIVPTNEQQDTIDRIIFDELVRDVVNPSSQSELIDICGDLSQRGAHGVILGCTELFMIVTPSAIPDMAIFDSTDLHASAAVDLALELT